MSPLRWEFEPRQPDDPGHGCHPVRVGVTAAVPRMAADLLQRPRRHSHLGPTAEVTSSAEQRQISFETDDDDGYSYGPRPRSNVMAGCTIRFHEYTPYSAFTFLTILQTALSRPRTLSRQLTSGRITNPSDGLKRETGSAFPWLDSYRRLRRRAASPACQGGRSHMRMFDMGFALSSRLTLCRLSRRGWPGQARP